MNARTAATLRVDRDAEPSVVVPLPLALALAPSATAVPVAPSRLPALQRGALALADLAAATIVVGLMLVPLGRTGHMLALVCAPLVVVCCKLVGLYDRRELRLVSSTLDEAPALARISGLVVLGIAIPAPALLHVAVSGVRLAALWAALLTALVGGRVLARALTDRLLPEERCLVIGDLETARRLGRRMRAGRVRGRIVAAIPLDRQQVAELAELGTEGWIRDLVGELDAHRIIVAPGAENRSAMADLLRIARLVGVRVSVLPGPIDLIGPAAEVDEVVGLRLLGVRPFGLSRSARAVKRSFDLLVATLGVIVISPVIAAIALAIVLDSDGRVFFRQIRVGRDGRHFRMIKFRSMVQDAEARQDELRALSEAGEGLFKMRDDPRVTRVGRFLRRSSLDELPQIFNVLRGEMSLVGPRPLVVDEDAGIRGLDRGRLSLTPGMTGPWQVLPVRLPREEMIEIDYRYADSWSLWLDVKVLARTVAHVARRGNI
jgi:exopolysaccharide biosynthesis polyprenyl glycosylphosphotransferase